MNQKVAVCPVCGYLQPVNESDLGKEVVCDLCGATFTVTELKDAE